MSVTPSPRRLVRAPSTRAWTHRETLTVLSRDGRALRFDGASADLCLAVIEHLSTPRDRAAVLAHVEALSGAPLASTEPVDQLLEALASIGAIRDATDDRTQPNDLPTRRVVLCVSGAVAAAHCPMLVTLMLRERWELRLAATENALRFVAREALEAIACATLHASHWERGDRARAHHIELAEWAELVLVYPASATTLSRIARGDCSDVVSATAVATRAPVVLVPSMNAAMYASPSVERNLRQLRDDGFHLVVPSVGVEVAHPPTQRAPMFGPAPSPDDVVAIARAVLSERDRSVAYLPTEAAGWEALHRRVPLRELPWFTDDLEADLAAALQALAHTGTRALDLGTGPGTVALYLARIGCSVVATDISATVLDGARARDAARAIEWRVDDACASAVGVPFELVVDRGCLHVLPRERHASWRESVRRVAAPGARLVLLVHDVAEGPASATLGYDEAGLRAFLEPICDEVRVAPSSMRGARGPARRAWLCTATLRA